jgi:hypothetical protein
MICPDHPRYRGASPPKHVCPLCFAIELGRSESEYKIDGKVRLLEAGKGDVFRHMGRVYEVLSECFVRGQSGWLECRRVLGKGTKQFHVSQPVFLLKGRSVINEVSVDE